MKTTIKKKTPPKKIPALKRFVIHDHYASHHHFDFRLEHNGTLKSWALPRGMPLKTGDKRLAIQVDDHPIEYISFSGIIPKGHYGAGKVLIEDKGTYKSIVWFSNKIEFILDGKKYKGKYIFVPLSGQSQWILIKGDNK